MKSHVKEAILLMSAFVLSAVLSFLLPENIHAAGYDYQHDTSPYALENPDNEHSTAGRLTFYIKDAKERAQQYEWNDVPVKYIHVDDIKEDLGVPNSVMTTQNMVMAYEAKNDLIFIPESAIHQGVPESLYKVARGIKNVEGFLMSSERVKMEAANEEAYATGRMNGTIPHPFTTTTTIVNTSTSTSQQAAVAQLMAHPATVYNGKDYSQEFDAAYYYAANQDLQTSIGADANALLAHYVQHGKAEGRTAIQK